jgi:hypothetical protein
MTTNYTYTIAAGSLKKIDAGDICEIRIAAKDSSTLNKNSTSGKSNLTTGDFQYLRNPIGEPYAVVFLSKCVPDISVIGNYWNSYRKTAHAFPGMRVFIIPKNPSYNFSTGIVFTLADIIEGDDGKQDPRGEYSFQSLFYNND